MLTKKSWRIVLPVLAALMAGMGWLFMDQPHRDVAAESAQFKLVPQELMGFMALEDSTSALYLNAVVELYAVVAQDDGVRASFEGGVVAVWDTLQTHRILEPGELLRVKGRVTGYDNLFEEVRMDGLVLVEGEKASQ
jgi:hypothetical protein